MRKRILSILLAAFMVVSLLPTVALATETAGLDNFKKVQTYTDGKFTDVKSDDWFEKNVSSAYELNLMVGKRNDFFDTESNLTVAEAMTIAARLRSIYYTGKAEFEQGDPWYQVYTDYCKVNGVADPSDYDLNKPITRGEFAEIFAKALPADALKKINTVQNNMIPDVKNADKFSAAIYLLYRAGVLVGNDAKGTFAPDTNIMRVEVAAITTRMAEPSLRQTITLKKQSSGGGGSYVPPAPIKYTVTFDMQGLGTPIDSITNITSGAKISEPAKQTADGKYIEGWYKEATFTNKWNFDSDIVTGNITLYANWITDNRTFKAVYDTTDSKNTLTFYYDAVDYSGDNITVYDNLTTAAEFQLDWGYHDIRSNVKSVVIDSSVANYQGLTSTANMFANMTFAKSISGAEYLDVSNVTNMSNMFFLYGSESNLNCVPNVKEWNTAKVTNMINMFNNYGASGEDLTSVPDVSKWNTASVTNMNGMFYYYGYSASSLNFSLDLSGWKINSVEDCTGMFSYAGEIATTWSVTIPAKTGQQANETTKWYVGDGVDTGTYIEPASGRSFTLDNRTFKAVYNTNDSANTLTFYYDSKDHSGDGITVYEDGTDKFLFDGTRSDNAIWGYNEIRTKVKKVVIDSSVANYTGLTSTAFMFFYMQNAESITGAEYLDVSNVTDMRYMFGSFGNISQTINVVPNVSNWNTAKVENMQSIFNSYGLKSTLLNVVPNVSNWNTANVTNMERLFSDYGKGSTVLNAVPNVSSWITSKVTNMSYIFYNYGYSSLSLTAVPNLSSWTTSEVEKMQNMFYSYGYSSTALNAVPDVSNWNTANVTNMEGLFNSYGYSSTALNAVPDVSKWNTSKVEIMQSMFHSYGYSSTALNAVPDVSKWNTSSVTDITGMFKEYGYRSTALVSVPDVSQWNTANVKFMKDMFVEFGYSSSKLNFKLDFSKWDVGKVTSYTAVFSYSGDSTTTWSVTIPAKTGAQPNDSAHWYVGDGINFIALAEGRNFTVAPVEATYTLTFEPEKDQDVETGEVHDANGQKVTQITVASGTSYNYEDDTIIIGENHYTAVANSGWSFSGLNPESGTITANTTITVCFSQNQP